MTLHDRLHWPLAPTGKHFGQGISPGHLQVNRDGTVSVSLAGNWPKFVQSLRYFGEVVITTDNQAVSLTQISQGPQFDICPCGRTACCSASGLKYAFAAWKRVWATRRQTGEKIAHTLAVTGHDDLPGHQILLPEEMAEEQLVQLVQKFQGNPAPLIDHTPSRLQSWLPDHTHSAPPSMGHLDNFRRRKREFIENTKNGARPLHRESLAEVWSNVIAERIRVGITVVTAPVIHAAVSQPVSLAESSTGLTLASREVFLRCHPEKIAGLWAVPLGPEPNSPCALETYDEQDNLLFALTVPPDSENIWREMLRWLPAI